VVAPEGLIGVVLSAAERTSIVMTWAHPEFRVSAFTVSGNAAGVVAPAATGAGEAALEFRGVPYRDSVPIGTLVLSSGLGGVYPKGIPVGTVTGVIREQEGWERVYRLLPSANPGSAAHVLILVAPKGDLARAFPGDSALAAQRRDSLERLRVADSVAQAAREAKAQRAESLAAARRDTTRARPRAATRPDSVAARRATAPGAGTSPAVESSPGAPEPASEGSSPPVSAPGAPADGPQPPAAGAPTNTMPPARPKPTVLPSTGSPLTGSPPTPRAAPASRDSAR
jgi:rod shape-determining protein MreC